MEECIMTMQNGNLVVSRRRNEILVVRHEGERYLIMVKERNSLTLQAPHSIRLVRGELEQATLPEKGHLVLDVGPEEGLVIRHHGATLRISFSADTRVVCHGPRSFDVIREKISDEPLAA